MGIERPALALPAAHVALDHAASLVRRVERESTRLDDPDDPDALHDTRVALRHLRSWLRTFRAALPVSRRSRRRLRRLARATNPARDAEVALLLFDPTSPHLAPANGFARTWLRSRIAGARDRSIRRARARIARNWPRLALRLHRELAGGDSQGTESTPFGAVAAQHLSALLGEMHDAAAGRPGPGAQHRLRIRAKRLRYLAEPLREACPQAQALVNALTDMQDRLGEVNDLWVAGQLVEQQVAIAAGEQAVKLCALARQPMGREASVRAAHARAPVVELALVLRALMIERDTALAYNTRDLRGMVEGVEASTRKVIACLDAGGPVSP